MRCALQRNDSVYPCQSDGQFVVWHTNHRHVVQPRLTFVQARTARIEPIKDSDILLLQRFALFNQLINRIYRI